MSNDIEGIRGKWKDKASITYLSIPDKIRRFIKLHDRRIKYGRDVIIKRYVEIMLADNAILEIGDNSISNMGRGSRKIYQRKKLIRT